VGKKERETKKRTFRTILGSKETAVERAGKGRAFSMRRDEKQRKKKSADEKTSKSSSRKTTPTTKKKEVGGR